MKLPNWDRCNPPDPKKMTRSDEAIARADDYVVAQYVHDDTGKLYRRVLCVEPKRGEPKIYWLVKRS